MQRALDHLFHDRRRWRCQSIVHPHASPTRFEIARPVPMLRAIEEGLPVFCVVPPRGRDQLHDKMVSGIQEVRARGARTIVLAEEGVTAILPPLHPTIESGLVELYAEVSGRQVDDIDYYVILAKWKLAVVLEQGFQRAGDDEKLLAIGPVVTDLMARSGVYPDAPPLPSVGPVPSSFQSSMHPVRRCAPPARCSGCRAPAQSGGALLRVCGLAPPVRRCGH